MQLFKTTFTDSDIESITQVLKSGNLGFGPNVSVLEERYKSFSGKTHNVAVNSASAAAFMIFAYLKEQYGECDVYTTSIAFTSPAWAAKHFGHRLIWVDVDDNLLFDCDDYLKRSELPEWRIPTGRQKVVMPILYGGVSTIPNWKLRGDEIVVVDSAHCATPTLKSDFTFFSFHPFKPIAASDGGMISTDDEHAALWFESYRNFGRVNMPNGYDIVQSGFKFYMNNLNAAIALTQLDHYHENVNTRKQNHVLLEQAGLGRLLPHDEYSSYYFATLIAPDATVAKLSTKYPTSKHYPMLHMTSYYTYTHLPKTERIHTNIINLPLFEEIK